MTKKIAKIHSANAKMFIENIFQLKFPALMKPHTYGCTLVQQTCSQWQNISVIFRFHFVLFQIERKAYHL